LEKAIGELNWVLELVLAEESEWKKPVPKGTGFFSFAVS
jgi:hypothetical protein